MKTSFEKFSIESRKNRHKTSIAILVFSLGIYLTATGLYAQVPISNCAELQAITNDPTGSYYLTQDIDCSGMHDFKPIGSRDEPFNGTFDGKNHVIHNLNIHITGEHSIGALFSYIDNDGHVKNLHLKNAKVKSEFAAAVIAGISSGKISDCIIASAIIEGGVFTGGIAGLHPLGTIENCKVSAMIIGSSLNEQSFATGGIVAMNDAGAILNCSAEGSVMGSLSVGGLVGVNAPNGIIENSFSAATVKGDTIVGGLVGGNDEGLIRNSYATGTVNGHDFVGGLAGANLLGVIDNSYAAGKVTGNVNTGGLVGLYEAASYTLNNCFWNTESTGQKAPFGVKEGRKDAGRIDVSGLSNEQMRLPESFLDWDFDNVWQISDQPGGSFPRLIRNPQVPPPGSTEK